MVELIIKESPITRGEVREFVKHCQAGLGTAINVVAVT